VSDLIPNGLRNVCFKVGPRFIEPPPTIEASSRALRALLKFDAVRDRMGCCFGRVVHANLIDQSALKINPSAGY
jgi:hypothetical protein